MVVILLVVLFCVGLIITLIGLQLSPHSRTRKKRNVAYTSCPVGRPSQGDRARDGRRRTVADEPYRQWKRPYAPVRGREVEWGQGRGQAASLRIAATPRLRVSSERSSSNGIVGLWSDFVPHWLKLMLLSGAVFSLCLFLFGQIASFSLSPAIAIMGNLAPQPNSVSAGPMVYGETLDASNASKAMVRVAQ